MKHIPDEKQIEELLGDFPPGVSGKFDSRLSFAPWTPRAVRRRRRINVAIAGALTLTLLAAFTPQSRAWAEKFFFILQLIPYASTPTPIPSFTPTPYALDEIEAQVQQVNEKAGFAMLRPSVLPYGYRFWGAEYFQDNKSTCQWYGYGPQPDPSTNGKRGFNGDMFLCQSRMAPYLGFDSVGTPGPEVTVEKVNAGSFSGEYTALGNFREYLTWQQKGYFLYLVAYSSSEYTPGRIYPSKEEMVAVASSVTSANHSQVTATPAITPATTSAPFSMTFNSVEELEAYTGFRIPKPTILPKNFIFAGAELVTDQGIPHFFLSYDYGHPQVGIAGLRIEMVPVSEEMSLEDFSQQFPSDAVTSTMVGEWPALYVVGGYQVSKYVTPGPVSPPIWLPDSPERTLYWQTDKFGVKMDYWASSFYDGRLEQTEMLAIAESMK